jgi:hypothetical protein
MKTIDVYDSKGRSEVIEMEAWLAREHVSPEQCEMVRMMGTEDGLDVMNSDGQLFSVTLAPWDEVDMATADPVDDDEVDDLRP